MLVLGFFYMNLNATNKLYWYMRLYLKNISKTTKNECTGFVLVALLKVGLAPCKTRPLEF